MWYTVTCFKQIRFINRSPFLKTGVIFASLRLSGKQQVSMELFIQSWPLPFKLAEKSNCGNCEILP